MDITLRADDFARVFKSQKGIFAQYSIMPIAGLVLALAFETLTLVVARVALVGICLGGTDSNLITYLAKGTYVLRQEPYFLHNVFQGENSVVRAVFAQHKDRSPMPVADSSPSTQKSLLDATLV